MEVKKQQNCLFIMFIAFALVATINTKEHPKEDSEVEKMAHKAEQNETSARKKINENQSENCKFNNVYAEAFTSQQCDILTDGPICVSGLNRVLLPSAAPNGLVGHWSFDESLPIDSSGQNNHAKGKFLAGSAFGGEGSSALFSSGDYLEVPFSKSFISNEFSVTFWMYVVQDYYNNKSTRFCPIIQRGVDDLASKTFKRAPALYYDRKAKNLKFYVKTTNPDNQQGESVTTNGTISPQRWLHIALVKQGYKLRLYVNGILDNEVTTTQNIENNEDPLFVGNVPWLKDQCDFPYLIDELRYYNIAVEEDFIQAEASPSLGGIEPNFIQLGCIDCTLKEASNSCVDGYHLCTSIELHTGGYQVARAMGWLKWNTHIWSHGALKNAKRFKNLKGISLCCADLK